MSGMTYYHTKYGSGGRKPKSRFSRIIVIILALCIVVAGIIGYRLYVTVMKPNVWVKDNGTDYLYIPTGADFQDLETILYENGFIVNRKTFSWIASRKNLPAHVHPGRYEIHGGMSNNELINLLRSGQQTPVNLIFNNIRTKPQLAQRLSEQIEPDSLSIITLLNDQQVCESYGFDQETILCMFLPNTYEVFWDITPEKLVSRMDREYEAFWNESRRQKAAELNLTPVEVSILASIVEKETVKNDEKPAIAGVYLNRLKYGWKLQADPTIVYAWGDFSINRVLNIHKQLDSPYNTYLHAGLPPGPICLPSIASIESVLNAENHDYFFFCAKADFSGYHEFARTAAQHAVNANRYRRALDERGIMN